MENVPVPDVELLSGIHFLLFRISERAVSEKRKSGFHLSGELLLICSCLSSEPWAACTFSDLARMESLCKRPAGICLMARCCSFYLFKTAPGPEHWFQSQNLWLHSDGERGFM